MAKVTVEGVEFDTSTLTDNAKAQVASLQFLQQHMTQLKNEITVLETAQSAYVALLRNALSKDAE